MKKILVTGGTGFIGQHLVRELIRDNHQITVLTRSRKKAESAFGDSVKIFVADIRDNSQLAQIHANFHWIFHLAAALAYRNATKEELFQTNVEGSRNILNLAKRMTDLEKLVYVSTVGVYGPVSSPPATERTPHQPERDYEISKELGERLAWEYIKEGMPINIIRPALVYGPGDTASGMFSLFKACAKGQFMSVGQKQALMHPLYIDNLTQALLLAAESAISGEDFIIGDARALPLSELAGMIANEADANLLPFTLPHPLARIAGAVGDFLNSLGLPFPLTTPTVKFMTQHRAYSIEKARNLLGYNPKIPTEEGIKRTLEWYRDKGIL